MTGAFSGSGGEAAAAAPAQVAPEPQPIYNQPAGASQQNPCEFEIKQFMDCAQKQGDITLCQGFNEAIKLCKQQNGEFLHFKFGSSLATNDKNLLEIGQNYFFNFHDQLMIVG